MVFAHSMVGQGVKVQGPRHVSQGMRNAFVAVAAEDLGNDDLIALEPPRLSLLCSDVGRMRHQHLKFAQVVAAEPLQAKPRISWRMALPAFSPTAGEKLVNSRPRRFIDCRGLKV
jgi:hypothetical protein